MRRGTQVLAIALVSASLAPASLAGAQEAPRRPELRALVGVAVPGGGYRRLVRTGLGGGLAVAVPLAPWWAGVAGVTFVDGDTRATGSDAGWAGRVRVVQPELAVELRAARPFGGGWSLDPFIGGGAGVRVYRYRSHEPDAAVPVAFGVGGAELRLGRGAVRVELREQVFRFQARTAGVLPALRSETVARVGLGYRLP